MHDQCYEKRCNKAVYLLGRCQSKDGRHQKLKVVPLTTKKKVTSDKRACVAAFGKCKKMEDESVKLIHTCMDDHSMKLINQTAASLHSGAMKDTGKALGEAEDTAKAVIAGEVNIGKQLDEDPYNDNK
eukprot:TRINITY_DN2799_c0_g1_i2.p1 TRINITY_DN2799_c0_g1~~TRINITY_DN2799_c0_g1_i2.p1  ORF type:complete len:128 (-),score=31.11 TRINITY_DN2799_c0_g1_i2:85-468(-)